MIYGLQSPTDLSIVSLGAEDDKKEGDSGGFLVTVLLMITAGAVGYAIGIDRGGQQKRRNRF